MGEGRILIVGLGNPGPGYARNRHNIGFMLVDRLAGQYGIPVERRQHLSLTGTGAIEGRPVILAKPWTFMNRSGQAVRRLVKYAGLEPADLWVLHDDLDLAVGRIRLKDGGGHGGHNGLRSLMADLGTGEFRRLKIGIGRPEMGTMTPEEWVLADFTPDERPVIAQSLERAVDLLTRRLKDEETNVDRRERPAG